MPGSVTTAARTCCTSEFHPSSMAASSIHPQLPSSPSSSFQPRSPPGPAPASTATRSSKEFLSSSLAQLRRKRRALATSMFQRSGSTSNHRSLAHRPPSGRGEPQPSCTVMSALAGELSSGWHSRRAYSLHGSVECFDREGNEKLVVLIFEEKLHDSLRESHGG